MEVKCNASGDVWLIFLRDSQRSGYRTQTHLEIPPLAVAVKAPGDRPKHPVGIVLLRKNRRSDRQEEGKESSQPQTQRGRKTQPRGRADPQDFPPQIAKTRSVAVRGAGAARPRQFRRILPPVPVPV